ncbi:MAG: thiamine-phosphate kinase [Gammaproteobacteria bacterium]|nr:thiamine-phosphate kinase [Gammaproteobacteria bacterium]
MNNEFDIIKKYFTFAGSRHDVVLAGGDDCASVIVPEKKQLMITTDTLVSGVHFPEQTAAEDIAYKAVMVNLSDLAAMGANPAWMTLAITLPDIDEDWLSRFSRSLSQVLQRFNVSLIGGDTTRGPLSITIQAMGLCDAGRVLQRDQAEAGDSIFVTGYPGDAAIGLAAILDNLDETELQSCINRLNRPEARVNFAQELVAYSRCAIDVSDGLVADLGHIVDASACGARVSLSDIPVSSAARYYFDNYCKSVVDWPMLLSAGDDYELCFTVHRSNDSAVEELAKKHHLQITRIGEITESQQLVFLDEKNQAISFDSTGYKHF